MLDINSLKKLAKWFFCDRAVVFSIALGIILLLLTLTVYAKDVKPIRYRGIDYDVCRTAYSRLLFKMTTPALTVRLQLRKMPVETIPQHLILYSLMFIVQIVVYGIVGKVASYMSSDWIVTGWVCLGIVFLALALAYEVNPAQISVVDAVRGKPFELLLVMSNLVVSFSVQRLLVVYGGTILLSYILFPLMFTIQILIYGFLGKLVSSMLPSVERDI